MIPEMMRRSLSILILPALGLALAGCPRETRSFRSPPAANARPLPVRMVSLQPGAALPQAAASGPYEGNAWAISQGERLYEQYNCAGCHFHGGGGIGPPLMDAEWIYGGSGQNIHDTIVEGRPNGMPSYGGHIPDDQVWMIAAYVRTLSGQVPKAESPTRSDELFPHPSEQAMPRKTPQPGPASHP
jgi:cytochrome c oxidase cbb3-type subunit III